MEWRFNGYTLRVDLRRYPRWKGLRYAPLPVGLHSSLSYTGVDRSADALIAEHRRHLAANPEDHMTRLALANCLRMRGLVAEARAEYEKLAVSDSPAVFTAQHLLEEAQKPGGWKDTGSYQRVTRLLKSWSIRPLYIPWPLPPKKPVTPEALAVWRRYYAKEAAPWVLFDHGTCVLLREAQEPPAYQAQALLRKWGPVYAGSPAGDFDVVTLPNKAGWIVTCHHPDILNYLAPEELPKDTDTDEKEFVLGLMGRSKRDRDGY
jgi:hypothetical protein